MKFTEYEQRQIESLLLNIKDISDVEKEASNDNTSSFYLLKDFESEEERKQAYIKLLEYAEVYDLENEVRDFLTNEFYLLNIRGRNNLLVSTELLNYEINNKTIGFLTFLNYIYNNKSINNNLLNYLDEKIKEVSKDLFFDTIYKQYYSTNTFGTIGFYAFVKDNVVLTRYQALSLLRIFNRIDYYRHYYFLNLKQIDDIPRIEIIFDRIQYRKFKKMIKDALK